MRQVLLIVLVLGLAACASRGDFGRARDDFVSKTVWARVDRHLLAGGKIELSNFPVADQERRMYDVLWRYFSAPYEASLSILGTPRISPFALKSGAAFDRTDRYYSYLRHSGFKSSRGRYNAMVSKITSDLDTLDAAFEAICAVQKLDENRQIAADTLTAPEEDQQRQLAMRLEENASAIRLFAKALDFRFQSYSYALKRLLVETPDEAARSVDAKLSAFGIGVERARRGAYCS